MSTSKRSFELSKFLYECNYKKSIRNLLKNLQYNKVSPNSHAVNQTVHKGCFFARLIKTINKFIMSHIPLNKGHFHKTISTHKLI